MTIISPSKYWIAENAVTITRNAMSLPDYVQVSVSASAVIMAFAEGIPNLDYDAGHNYRRWHLTASPTYFYTHSEKYVHVAIPRNGDGDAQIVFPSEQLDIYGNNAEGTKIGSDNYYYLFLGGILTSSGDNGTTPREWKSVCEWGRLRTDEAISNPDTDWYQYSPVNQLATFLKDLTMKADTKFRQLFALAINIVTGGSITFGEGEDAPTIIGIADGDTSPTSETHIVTPAYGEGQWLSKKHDDTADGNITIKGKVDVFGNLVTKQNATIDGTAHIKGNVTIGTPLPSTGEAGGGSDMQHWGKSEWGTFIKGIIGGSGAQIDIHGNAELESLIVRKFLEVPELRYNRVEVHSGTKWFTKGSGLIESVDITNDTHGTITLHLEDGEFGTAAVDDYCMGIFHNLDGNATEDQDDRNGVLQYKGFSTVYFFITAVRGEHNEILDYELRPVSELWDKQIHPCSQMTFACYANPNNKDRQSAVLSTTDYTVYMRNLTNWTFGPDNYYLIFGLLEGFSAWATNQNGERYLKRLHGNSAFLGDVYMYGTIDQFSRLADTIDITASPRINADFTVADGEVMTLTAQMLSYDGIKRTGVIYNIKRYSDNSDSDAEWNERRGNDIKDGTIDLTTEDTKISEGVFDPAVQFTILATRILPSEEGGAPYTVERDIIVKNVGSYKMEDDNLDPMIAPEEAKHYNFTVYDGRGLDITAKVTRWSIERHTADPTADTLWAMRDKVKNFAGSIDLLWSPSDPTANDMDPDESKNTTTFLITAYIGTTPVAQQELNI